jgi:hypothetical protein
MEPLTIIGALVAAGWGIGKIRKWRREHTSDSRGVGDEGGGLLGGSGSSSGLSGGSGADGAASSGDHGCGGHGHGGGDCGGHGGCGGGHGGW